MLGKGPRLGVVVIADPRAYRSAVEEVRRVVATAGAPVAFVSGLAYDPKGAELLRGRWGGRLDRSLLIRTARELAGRLAAQVAPAPAGPPGRPVVPRPRPGEGS